MVCRDLASLEACVWEGCGTQLLGQRTNSTKVSKLLDNVPQFLVIKIIKINYSNIKMLTI